MFRDTRALIQRAPRLRNQRQHTASELRLEQIIRLGRITQHAMRSGYSLNRKPSHDDYDWATHFAMSDIATLLNLTLLLTDPDDVPENAWDTAWGYAPPVKHAGSFWVIVERIIAKSNPDPITPLVTLMKLLGVSKADLENHYLAIYHPAEVPALEVASDG